MLPDSITALRQIRARLERSFVIHPEFQVRFVFGVQTGFEEIDRSRWERKWDWQARGKQLQHAHFYNWEQLGTIVGLANRVNYRDYEIRSYFWSNNPAVCPGEHLPCRSFQINALYASDGHDLALRLFLDDYDALHNWLWPHFEHFPVLLLKGQAAPFTSWHGFVCLMKLAEPDRFSFHLGYEKERVDQKDPTRPVPLIDSPEMFWRVVCLELQEDPSIYLMVPNLDARLCSIEVIDRLIEIVGRETDKPDDAPPVMTERPVEPSRKYGRESG